MPILGLRVAALVRDRVSLNGIENSEKWRNCVKGIGHYRKAECG